MSNQILKMKRWQQQVQAGNECFNAHQLFAAVAHYQSAKQLAWGCSGTGKILPKRLR
ncbi:hypothetical protein [Aliamphritea spongicola]|nr:hypothetical protein [Aliamphritea spongicola]